MHVRTVIIDVGAGFRAKYSELLQHNPGLIIHAIHPHPTVASALREVAKFDLKTGGRLRVHEFVATDKDGEEVLHLTDDIHSSSILEVVRPNIRRWKLPLGRKRIGVAGSLKVIAKTLNTFVEEVDLVGSITYINIDVPGYSKKVLDGITTQRVWNVIKEISVKVHNIDYDLYRGQTKLSDVMDILAVHGFSAVTSKLYSQSQEFIITCRNQIAVDLGWPFDKYGWAHKLSRLY